LYSCHGLTAYESNAEGTLCKRDAWVYFGFTTAIGKKISGSYKMVYRIMKLKKLIGALSKSS